MGGAAWHRRSRSRCPLTGGETIKDKGYTHDLAKARQPGTRPVSAAGSSPAQCNTDAVAPGGASYETVAVKVKSDPEQIEGLKIELAPAPGTSGWRLTVRRLPGDALALDAGLYRM